jgi:hypothetical protein
MKKASRWGVAFVVLMAVSGCGSSADSLMKDMIADMNALADLLEKGDEARINDAKKRLEETGKKLDALKLSEEDKKKLQEKYKPEMEKAASRMMGGMMKQMGKGLPGLGGNLPTELGSPVKK